jgi:orotate phosphoribosyltransferase
LPASKSGEEVKIEICRILNRIGALSFGAFKLTSGKLSPYYIDLRIVPSFPDAFREVCDFYVNFIGSEVGMDSFERIAGIPVAGIPFAVMTAYLLKKPFLYVRKGARLHGRERRIEGVIAPGDRVLLVEDVITTGLSLSRAAKAVTAEGGVVADAVVLLDRVEGGEEKLAQNGIKLHAPLNIVDAAETLYQLGTIDKGQLETICKQVKKK